MIDDLCRAGSVRGSAQSAAASVAVGRGTVHAALGRRAVAGIAGRENEREEGGRGRRERRRADKVRDSRSTPMSSRNERRFLFEDNRWRRSREKTRVKIKMKTKTNHKTQMQAILPSQKKSRKSPWI